MTHKTVSKGNQNISFPDLKLKAGAGLSLQSLGKGITDCEVDYVASLRGKSIVVAQPDGKKNRKNLQVGDQYTVRGFNGTSEFTFTSEILQVQKKPFLHVHLAYPDLVEIHVVRDAPRVKVSIPVVVTPSGTTKPILGMLKNLSVIGVMIESVVRIGIEGDKINIAFSTKVDEKEVDVKIPAVIRNVHKHDADRVFSSGLEFGNVTHHDKLILYYLLFIHSENT